MKIAIDISPLKTGNFLAHRVRGTGFYIENLRTSLEALKTNNSFTYFTQGEILPKDTNIVHFPYFEPFFLTLPKKKYKTVVTVHDLTPLVFPNNFPRGVRGEIKWRLQKSRLSRVDAIIADSQCSKRDIEQFIGKNFPISVVYLASDGFKKKKIEEKKKREILEKFNLPTKFLLYVGDATWNKNLPKLLEAVRGLNIPLAMVGNALTNTNMDLSNPWNRDLSFVRRETKSNKNIKMLGFVSHEDLEFLYNLTTLFVMPSLYEGFGLPLLEAMSCGAACITSKEGSLPEVAGDAAYYVDSHSVGSIKEGIEELLKNVKIRNNLGEKGIAQASKFSWEKTAKETLKVYESL